jgi:flagellar biosynthesis/type III secretory pathway M-ring protein FliF/YscJ
METVRKAMESVRAMWTGMSASQRAAVAVLAVALAVAVAWGASAAGSRGERALVGPETPYDQQEQVRAKLAELGIPHRIRDGGIWVAAERIDEARLSIAAITDDVPVQKGSDWFASPGEEAARRQQALQYKLARMITKIEGVKSASVQLTLPRRSHWKGDNEDGSAAVVVELKSGAVMNRGMVNSAAQLVAGGTGIKAEHVRVIGPTGVYYGGDDSFVMASDLHDQAMQMGAQISRTIEKLLPIEARVMTTAKLSPKKSHERREDPTARPDDVREDGKDKVERRPYVRTVEEWTPAGAELIGLSVAVVIPVNAATPVPSDEELAKITGIIRNATGITDERNITVATVAVPLPAAVTTSTWPDAVAAVLEHAGKVLLVLLVLAIGYGVWRLTRASVDRSAVEVEESARPEMALAGETDASRLREGASEAVLRDPRAAADLVRRMMER